MTTPKNTPVPDMPGFSRDENGNLQFDPFDSNTPPTPSLVVKEWRLFYAKAPVIFGYSPESEAIEKFLKENPRAEFRFCTTALDEKYSANITYHCVPIRHEVTLMEAEIFAPDGAFLGRFPDTNFKIPPDFEKVIDEAIIMHVLPIVESYE